MSHEINVNFKMPTGGDTSLPPGGMMDGIGTQPDSSAMLNSILSRLEQTLTKLNSSISRANRREDAKVTAPGSAAGGGGTPSDAIFAKLASTIGSSIGAAIGVTTARVFNANADAIMARANNAGTFIGAAIQGQANQAFGGYASRYFDIERQRQITINRAIGEGAGGLAGEFVGMAVGTAIGTAMAPPGADIATAVMGAKAGALGGGAAGVGAGKWAADKYLNQYIEQHYQVASAMVKTLADVSVSQWQTGFSRWGMGMTDTTLVNGSLTGGNDINAPLAQGFINHILKGQGGIMNLKDIQQSIVPYMTTDPMSSTTDLNKLVNQFKQAGFAVSDFSKLTMQGSQYMAITGKQINDFGNDIFAARVKFGDSYGASTNQLALNLMSGGMEHDNAQMLAFQSQYNPNLLSGYQIYANSAYSDFWRRKSLSKVVGVDVNKWMSGNVEMSAANTKMYQQDISDYLSGKNYDIKLELLRLATGWDIQTIASRLQGKVATGSKGNSNLKLGPGADAAMQAGTASDLLNNAVNDMHVTATNLYLTTGLGQALKNIFPSDDDLDKEDIRAIKSWWKGEKASTLYGIHAVESDIHSLLPMHGARGASPAKKT